MQTHTRCTFPVLLAAVLVAGLITLFAAPAMAQTPDLIPPARETACGGETGAAFGWCNAYCEAMDCELANDNDPLTEPKASSTACEKVRSKFQQNTGRDLPCEVTCPCTDFPQFFPLWAGFLAGEFTADFCFQDGGYCEFIDEDPALCTPPAGDVTAILTFSGDQVFASSLGTPLPDLESPFCGETPPGSFILLTPEEGAKCKAQLDAVLAASGVGCNLPI